MIRTSRPRKKRDTTIAMINVVFLMLIFFLIAGTIAPPVDPDLKLVDTSELAGSEPPDALVLRRDGTLYFRGDPIDPQAYIDQQGTDAVRIVPDKEAPASRLIEVSGALRRLGAVSVIVVTEQALR